MNELACFLARWLPWNVQFENALNNSCVYFYQIAKCESDMTELSDFIVWECLTQHTVAIFEPKGGQTTEIDSQGISNEPFSNMADTAIIYAEHNRE